MKKLLCAICIGLLSAGAAHADVVLNIPANDNYAMPTTVITNVTSAEGATFDVSYTLSATSNDTGAVVGVIGQMIGVGSDNDINPNHFNTLEGTGAVVPNPDFDPDNPDSGPANFNLGGEGLSFTNLTISNFMDNGSGIVESDITNLQFDDVTFGAVTNGNDGVNISYTDFGVDTTNQNLNSASTGAMNPFTLELPAPTDGSLIDGVFLTTDTGQASNRWNISGLQVSFDSPASVVPEPTTFSLLGFGAIALFAQRRKRN